MIVISEGEERIFDLMAIRAQRLRRVWYAVVLLRRQEDMGDGSGATLIEAVTVAQQRALAKEAS